MNTKLRRWPLPIRGHSTPTTVRGSTRTVLLATISAWLAAACLSPAGALAAWPFDAGLNPSVAASNFGPLVEVHQAGAGIGPLWYSLGTPRYPAYGSFGDAIQWQWAQQYDFGANPAVADGGVPNAGLIPDPAVVEVHQGQAGPGTMWWRVGTPAGNSINWGPSHPYDYGSNPSIATGGYDNEYVVEVHDGGWGVGPLWYKVGIIGHNQTIYWGHSWQYDSYGIDPMIAIYGDTVVEVNGTSTGAGALNYRVGTLSPEFLTVSWGPAQTYSSGANPAIASLGSSEFREVHQAGVGSGPLVTQTGTIAPTPNVIDWSPIYFYDNGARPRITGLGDPCSSYVEVHNGQDASGPLWYHASMYGCLPPPQ